VTARGPAYGKAQIWVDGVLKKTVNLYNASQQWQYPVTVSGLAYGHHTVVIKVLGTKSSLSTGTGVVCDGFVIE
jgi:bacillopeptidase F